MTSDLDESAATNADQHRRPYYSRLRQAWKQTTVSNKLIVLFTAVIAISNFFYMLYARRQWQVMSGQLTETARQYPELQKSANAARDSAAFARTAVENSDRAFKEEERAYLWAISYNLSAQPVCVVPGKPRICADVHVVNSGRTPAIGVLIQRYATFGPKAERTIRAIKFNAYRTSLGDVLGTTGDKWGTAVTEPIDDPTVAAAILNGKVSLYVYGVVQYLDIFGDYHETGFCSFRLPNNGPFMTCEYGNWFDKKPAEKR